MPIYVYEEVMADGSGGDRFEWMQPMSAAPLTAHPETGVPVRRVIGVPNAPRSWTDSHAKDKTSDGSLERMGFTKYVKNDNGNYQKLFGQGPDTMNRPPQE